MLRKRHPWVRGVAIVAILVAGVSQAAPAWARPPAMKLLPEKTALMISVTDCRELVNRFMNTAIGRISQDPQLNPLLKQLYGSLVDLVAEAREGLGASLPEILAIPQGEFTFSMVATEKNGLAFVLLLDAGDKIATLRTLWQRFTAGTPPAQWSQEKIGETSVSIYRAPPGDGLREIAFFDKEGCFVLATDLDVARGLLDAWNGGGGKTLSQNANFAAMLRRGSGDKSEDAQAMWYVDPLALLRGVAHWNPEMLLVLALLPSLGLDGLQGAGGTLALDTGQFDAVAQFHVLLENPRSGVFDVVAFQDGDSTPEPWVPSDVVSYVTFHWDFMRSYKSIAKIYDSMRGDGALAGQIKREFEDPSGVNLTTQILPALDGRVIFLNRIQEPITPNSFAILLAFKLKDVDAMRTVLEKLMTKAKDEFVKQSVSGKEFYQAHNPSRPPEPPPGADPKAAEPIPPLPCLAIFNGYFVFTTHRSLLEKIFATADKPSDSLSGALDFRVVASKLRRRAGSRKVAMMGFQRPDEGMRFFYTLATGQDVRDGLKREAERKDGSPMFKTLNSALQAHPLPPFEALQRYMAPRGAMVIDDETGLHYTAILLQRK